MTRAELLIAGRMMKIAAEEFGNHGCNDVEDSMFAGVSDAEKHEMLASFNEWNGSEDEPVKHPGDSGWMSHFAALLLLESHRKETAA